MFQRIEPEIAPDYRKDPADEAFLRHFNDILAPYQAADLCDLPEVYPTLHVIGAPRSGTTMLMQLIATRLKIGYVNNLIASFWRAPVYGVRLSKKLLPPGVSSSFESDFGRTASIYEPHEWGYFWAEMLGYREMREQDEEFENTIDWPRLRRVLINMTHAFGMPAAFKPVLLAWHLSKMQEVLPKACFVRIRRDPVQNALSLIQFRKKFLGSEEKWVSLMPKEYEWLKDEPYWKQVAGQVYFIEKRTSENIAKVGGRNVLEVDYETMCADPRGLLERIQAMLEANGGQAELLSAPPAFDIRERDASTHPDYERVRNAVREFYGS